MPVHGRPFEKGNLYVRFNVQFPTALSPASRTQLASLLPGGPPSNGTMDLDDAEHVRTWSSPGRPTAWLSGCGSPAARAAPMCSAACRIQAHATGVAGAVLSSAWCTAGRQHRCSAVPAAALPVLCTAGWAGLTQTDTRQLTQGALGQVPAAGSGASDAHAAS